MNSVSLAPRANHDHSYSSLGRFNNTPIAVAGSRNRKVEELKNGVWRTLDDFLLVEKKIYYYSMVTLNDALYLFGTFSLIINLFDNVIKGAATG